ECGGGKRKKGEGMKWEEKVGGVGEKMKVKVVEGVGELLKEEVGEVGVGLGLVMGEDDEKGEMGGLLGMDSEIVDMKEC
ncbi:hypothetical protein, partial [Neisseria sicca]|uniref:hypothetical protein n=1 Tax=Neisseria sicca TaxID=490 RepID=UPI001C99F02D